MANLWPIVCLFLHLLRSTTGPQSVLRQQQQALLSNTHSPSSTLTTLVKLALTWKGTGTKGALSSSAALITIAASYLAVLFGAGLLSSRVQLSSDEVLVVGQTCGWLGRLETRPTEGEGLSEEEFINHRAATMAWGRWTASQSLDYFRNCYLENGLAGNSNVCRLFTAKNIQVHSEEEVDCPFSDDICDDKAAIRMDTGLIDSNTDLGINTGPGDRLWFRRVMTCAPVPAEERFSTDWQDEPPPNFPIAEGDQYKYYNLGGYAGNNFTWAVSNYSLSLGASTAVYDLQAIVSYAGNSEAVGPVYEVLPDLEVSDADVTILRLYNNARYLTPVEDAWFRATNKTDPTGVNRLNPEDHYMSDRIISTLGCTSAFQFCNTTTNCSPLQGIRQAQGEERRGLRLTTTQAAIFDLVESMAMSASLENGVYFLGSQILTANDFLWTGAGTLLSSGLASTHWTTEMTNIANLMLAAMQRLVVDYAALPEFPIRTTRGQVSSAEFVQPPGNAAERALCSAVRVRDARYANFSVVGLALVLAIGSLVILLNVFAFPAAVFWVRDQLRLSPYPGREWRRGHLFMQQREALEARGVGDWNIGKRVHIPWTTALVDGRDLMSGGDEGIELVAGDETRPGHVKGLLAREDTGSYRDCDRSMADMGEEGKQEEVDWKSGEQIEVQQHDRHRSAS